MKTKIQKTINQFWAWFTRQPKRIKIPLVLVLVIVIFSIVKAGGSSGDTVVETVKRQALQSSVSASGTVVSSTDLSLGFEVSKVVNSVRVVVGQQVKEHDVLATLSNGSEWAAVSSAKGALLAAQARYQKVLDGSSNEEIAVAKVALDNATRDLAATTKTQDGLVENARRTLNSSGLVAESSTVQSVAAPIISGTYTGNEGQYTLTLNAIGGESSYITYTGLETGTVRASTSTPQPLGSKGLTVVFPSGTSFNQSASWVVKIPNTASTVYVTNTNALIAAQNARDEAIASAQARVDAATADLALKRATARQADVDAALADVVTAQAGLDQANANFEHTVLRAPAAGTITRVSIKPGELAPANKEAIVLQDIGNLYLEANINESNIDRVAVGQPVTVTFDAFDGQTYHATLSSIDPAATITDNVVNYKVKALLTDIKDVRPGMTANMVITTNEVADAFVIPGRVITTKDGVSSVARITGKRNKTTQQTVTLGLRGDGDLVQITNGLSEGDRVLWTPPKKK